VSVIAQILGELLLECGLQDREETEDLAVADLEGDVAECEPVTETLAQPRRG
jgi:hypothetical protein